MTRPTTQRRLMALLVGAIHAIANSLFPVIDTVMRQPNRPWQQRARLADRFSRILMQLIGLSARIRPETLTRNPIIDPSPQPPIARAVPAAAPKPPGPIRPAGPLGPLRPARLLSARQFAQRLEILLRQLEQLAAEIGAALPPIIHRNIARARTIAGCNTLPPQTWERTG